jgi:hypothetical protein
MSNTFLSSCQDWLRIVHTDDFRHGRVINYSNICSDKFLDRGIVVLILAMCIITRPLNMNKENMPEPEPLRYLMYITAKQLFFCGNMAATTIVEAKPTLALIQAGLLLSVYEYGQGLLEASHATISFCSSMALVSGMRRLSLPDTRSISRTASVSQFEDETVQTWWGIAIHERFVSLLSTYHIPSLPKT